MDVLVLLLFCISLILCVGFGLSILLALLFGLVLFLLYGRYKGFSASALVKMCLSGIKTVKNILMTFLLIGMLTALWRACGCIPAIVYYASGFIRPSVFILLTFWLNALVSTLTGTSFGTAATIGVICMSISNALHFSTFWIGGAVLAGAFVGDRCSPVSTSALLVSTLTKTDIYENIKNMMKTAGVPFVLSSGIYLLAGFFSKTREGSVDVGNMFRKEFFLSPICLIPAGIVFLLALLRVSVKKTMLLSIISAFVIALSLQKIPLGILCKTLVLGYRARTPELAGVISGGGILSMVRVFSIVCIASAYSGIFKETGLLSFLENLVVKLADLLGHFRTMVVIGILTASIACNQTLAIMLSDQLTRELVTEEEKRALYLEDSVVLIAALIPWSIAGTVPLATIGAPVFCMLAACYLYILPLWRAFVIKKG